MAEKVRITLHCDCCPPGRQQGMAYQEDQRLIIVRQSHGKRHIKVVDLTKKESKD